MILTLQRISPEGPSFVGDEVEFHCNSTRFYFAYGIRWGWEKVGGEIEFIDEGKCRKKHDMTLFCTLFPIQCTIPQNGKVQKEHEEVVVEVKREVEK